MAWVRLLLMPFVDPRLRLHTGADPPFLYPEITHQSYLVDSEPNQSLNRSGAPI
jgi:hypothetical protein